MPVTEVQWIGASCGRHSSYTFYRGFRLIADGVEKKFCLGEFYFVRNSTNQPICIAELQLVWHDASTDNQLASARLYFRPEDTPIGRLPNHGQDELLYADQKVVIKCHDMARWQDSGIQWNSGMIPLYESDFVCVNDKYYLDSHYVDKERERQLKASESWKSGDQPRSLHILTFPAYCRYRALKKRLLAGACLAKAQLVALGGVLGNQTSQRVLFCRDSFHHPLLDKFELAGDNKAPVLKGRPRKKKNLHAAQNSVLKKKRLVAETQNHVTNAPAAKRCKISEQEETARSDMSERVLERIKVPPVSPRAVQNNVPPPLVKPKVHVTSTKPSDVPNAVVSNAPLTNTKAPPPLIPSDRLKGVAVTTELSHEQADMKVNECSRTTPMQKQIYPTDAKLRKTDQLNNNNKINSALLVKSHLSDSIKPSLTSDSLKSVSSSSEIKTGNMLNSSVRDNHGPTRAPAKSITNTSSAEHLRTRIPGVQAEALSSSSSATRPVASTQGTVGTQLAVSVSPAVRTQPVASLSQTVSSEHTIGSKTYQHVAPLAESVSTSGKPNDGLGTGAVRARDSKENEGREFRLATEGKREYEKSQTEEAVAWKKKMKRLRMPGNVKDEEYEDEDEKYFMQTLRDFMRKNNQPLGKLPALGFKKVNLWTMYNTAQRFGGYDAVTSKRLWRRVYDSLGGSATITSAATYTRRHYERLLLPYERHIRSQLKKQIDEKKPTPVKKPAAKEAPNKVEKKEGLTVSANSTPKPSLCPNTDKAATVKQTEGGNVAKIQRSNAVVSSPPVSHVKVSVPSDAKETAVKTTDSVHPVLAVTTSVTSKPHEVPISSIKHHEPTTRKDEVKVTASQPLALRTTKRDVIPSEQFEAASNQQVSNYQVTMTSNEEACARTNTVYTKNAAAVGGNSNQPHHGAALQRVAHDGTPLSSQPKKIITPGRGREIIDLTSEDSPAQSQARSQSLSHVQPPQANPLEKPQVSRLVSERDTDGGRRHASKSHLRKEFNDGSLRYQLNSDVQCTREMSTVCDKQVYSSKSQVKPKIPTSSAVTWVDSMERRYAHSPSSDSVDEHFAEWRRRQTNIPAQNVSHQREPGNPERSMLRYNYIKEEICPPDCSCLLSTSRKNDISSLPPPPKPKKEHYEEDVPFPGMTLYPGRWSPTMIAADHPDLYFSSHPPHLPSPQDTLASHMCTASRIFIPTAQIFSPPYHLGLPPMGGAPLITGTDDQLHIHPHLLMGSSYPCTSNARTPDGTPYLYSFT